MAKKAVEQTGLIPRSIIRTFDRFRKQLFPKTEKLIIQEFRISRYQFLVSIKCLANLIFVPLIVNYLLKNFLLIPVTENLWNTQQPEIFLNSYQQDRAFHELKKFQEKLYFEYLITDVETYTQSNLQNTLLIKKTTHSIHPKNKNTNKDIKNKNSNVFCSELSRNTTQINSLPYFTKLGKISLNNDKQRNYSPLLSEEIIQRQLHDKTLKLAVYYNSQSILALTNLVGDFITFIVISFLLVYMKPQIIILKSFLTESIYSLNDTKKSFLLILGTDLLVGFHSPRGWEICLQLVLRHFGFPENKDFVFLFVASFPVLLDTVFKYWIFRYLNKISPSTVATYHSMIE